MSTFKISWLAVYPLIFMVELLSAQGSSNDEWKLEKDDDGVKIYTKKIEDYKLKAFKGYTIVQSTPEELLNVIRDVEKYPQWMSHIAETYVVKKISNNELYVYSESTVPWPFSNRDIVTHSLLYWKDEKAFVEMTGIPDFIPENKGIVRIPGSKGLWIFSPISSNETEIIYEFQGDPGGRIPGWIANMFIVDGPFKTLTRLREYVMNSKAN